MNIYISKSGLHGKGIFAKKNIKKGEVIFIIKGEKIEFLINTKKQAHLAGFNWVGTGKSSWVDPINHCVFFNHSCDPNSVIKGRVTVIAYKDIKKDDEIVFDYSLNEADIFWHINCNCGTKKCRKVIRSIQFLPTNIFKKHEYHISPYYKYIFKNFYFSKFINLKELQKKWVNYLEKDFSV